MPYENSGIYINSALAICSVKYVHVFYHSWLKSISVLLLSEMN